MRRRSLAFGGLRGSVPVVLAAGGTEHDGDRLNYRHYAYEPTLLFVHLDSRHAGVVDTRPHRRSADLYRYGLVFDGTRVLAAAVYFRAYPLPGLRRDIDTTEAVVFSRTDQVRARSRWDAIDARRTPCVPAWTRRLVRTTSRARTRWIYYVRTALFRSPGLAAGGPSVADHRQMATLVVLEPVRAVSARSRSVCRRTGASCRGQDYVAPGLLRPRRRRVRRRDRLDRPFLVVPVRSEFCDIWPNVVTAGGRPIDRAVISPSVAKPASGYGLYPSAAASGPRP